MTDNERDKIRVIVCRVDERAEVIEIEDKLEAMQDVVGGLIQEYMPWEDEVAIMRPVIITSSDIRNRTAPTVIVLIITSQIKKLYLKEHVVLPKLKWLPKVSMAEAEQRATVDKSQLIEYCGRLSYEEFKNVHRALRFIEGTNRKEYERVY